MTLLDTLLAQPLGQHVVHAHRRESDRKRKFGVVPGHRGDVQVLGHLDLHGLVGHTEDGDDLPDTVGPVVEGEDRVALLDPGFGAPADDGLEELVRLPGLVTLVDRSKGVIRLFPFSLDQPVDGDLDPLPSLIPVHSVVPPDDGRDLSDPILLDKVEKLLQVPSGGFGGSVPTVTEKVDVDVGDLVRLGDLEELEQVEDVGVDTAVRDLPKFEPSTRISSDRRDAGI